jgi:hypothetical protein
MLHVKQQRSDGHTGDILYLAVLEDNEFGACASYIDKDAVAAFDAHLRACETESSFFLSVQYVRDEGCFLCYDVHRFFAVPYVPQRGGSEQMYIGRSDELRCAFFE